MEIMSQAYEKIHRMKEGCAKRHTILRVESGGLLSYTPLPTIPFAGSSFYNDTEVYLEDEKAQFIFSEILSCGRVAHDEVFQFQSYHNKVTIYENDRMLYRDNTKYIPEKMDMSGFGMYEGYTHLANLLLCNIPKSFLWMQKIRQMIDAAPELEGGLTTNDKGYIIIKILGKTGQKLQNMMRQILEYED